MCEEVTTQRLRITEKSLFYTLHNVEVKQIASAYLNLASVHLIILQSLVNKKNDAVAAFMQKYCSKLFLMMKLQPELLAIHACQAHLLPGKLQPRNWGTYLCIEVALASDH